MNDSYFGVLLEEIRDQNKAILETVGDMQVHVAKIPQMQEDIHELKQDMYIVKAAVVDTSRELRTIDERISRIEARA